MFRSAFSTLSRVPAPSIRRLSAAVQDVVPQSISKEALIKLRKSTGYSFVNCRKALVQCGENNLDAAEKWLKEVAIKEGWAKAAKLSNRETHQGVCAVVSQNNFAAILELNCETDFVARSDYFKDLVAYLTKLILQVGKNTADGLSTESGLKVTNMDFCKMQSSDGSPVQDAITAAIGKLGENITVSKAFAFVAPPSVTILGNAHPNEEVDGVKMGRYVSMVGIKRNEASSAFPTETLGSQICQHIIGMNPLSLGKDECQQGQETVSWEEDSAAREESSEFEDDEEEDHLNAFSKVETTKVDEDENRLLKQSFMLNPQQSVNQYLASHGAEVIDFRRFELGKNSE